MSETWWVVERSIADLGRLMESGERSAADITEAYLTRIAMLDGDLRSVVEENPDAQAIAAALDDERRAGSIRGPLHGIPVLLKENIDTADAMLTTAGSAALLDSMPADDSTTASRLRAAGAVLLGKTAMSEWAFFRSSAGTSGWSARNGQVRNPFDSARSPTGSSSGSGVAVSANLAAAAIGTETDGSIVSPASANGVVGLKPTVGLTSRAGVIPISHSQDTVGPLTRTVADAAAVLSAIAGPDPRDPATDGARPADFTTCLDPDGLRGRRIGIAVGLFGFSRHADRVAHDAIRTIRDAGAVVVEVPELRVARDLRDAEFEILLHEFKAGVEDYLATRTGNCPRTLTEVIEYNRRHESLELRHFDQDLLEQADSRGPLTSERYLEAVATASRLSRDEGLDRALGEHDLEALLAPTGAPATPIDLVNGDARSGGTSTLAATAGYPLISVPAGLVAGLPVGITLMGAAWSESTLIALASGYETHRGPRIRPPR